MSQLSPDSVRNKKQTQEGTAVRLEDLRNNMLCMHEMECCWLERLQSNISLGPAHKNH